MWQEINKKNMHTTSWYFTLKIINTHTKKANSRWNQVKVTTTMMMMICFFYNNFSKCFIFRMSLTLSHFLALFLFKKRLSFLLRKSWDVANVFSSSERQLLSISLRSKQTNINWMEHAYMTIVLKMNNWFRQIIQYFRVEAVFERWERHICKVSQNLNHFNC